ncbi:MAG: aspartate kinase [Lentisphaeraceae bacterium]|nr:aspartate kinase [Lentisphaeraceae bacterium]
MGLHTVEKIGGTSMSRFGELLDNIFLGNRSGSDVYNRIFVVSAYSGITNMLLEHKKTGESGVYQYFANGDASWTDALDRVEARMFEINAEMAEYGLNVEVANEFIHERISGIKNCLADLQRLCSYGHFQLDDYLLAVRELLSSIGEAHSAYNSVEVLKGRGINAVFSDLTGWKDNSNLTFQEKIEESFKDIVFAETLCVATGYTKCSEGLMETFDRGYSEITFSKIACVTKAKEGVIHKEFHLCSGDPNLIGLEKVEIIGSTNFDVADQLADLGMEAIHPKASKDMENHDIPIRVKNAFEPDHSGTLISKTFKSEKHRVEMITGRTDLLAIEVMDPDMVGQSGYDYRICGHFASCKISYIAKNTNANTITHYITDKCKNIDKLLELLKEEFPTANIRMEKVALVSAIGSNMSFPGLLAKATGSLANAGINILAVDQCMRQVNMQFIIEISDFDNAVKALHAGVVENI